MSSVRSSEKPILGDEGIRCERIITAGRGMVALCLLLLASLASAREEIPWNEDTDDPTLISLGLVGARVKTDHLVPNRPESHSSSGIVKYIFKNGPAEEKLKLDDEIVGVNGKRFNHNFSRRMGAAIDASEAEGEDLVLDILRAGKPMSVRFPTPKCGSFSRTYPAKCHKSTIILEEACDWLARHQWPNGKQEGDPNSGHLVLTAVAGLDWLATGNPKYEGNIDLTVKYMIEYFATKRNPAGHFAGVGLEGWQLMYGGMFLSEYYLASNDDRVLPTLEYINGEINHLQFRNLDPDTAATLRRKWHDPNYPDYALPPYWFSHERLTVDWKNSYLQLGVNTANALVAWQLLGECGVAVDRVNIAKTLDYIEVASPSGQMGYGGAPNQPGNDKDAFGRTGVLAVALHLEKRRPKYTRKVRDILVRDFPTKCFCSHASSCMGKAWGLIGLAALDRKMFRKAMDDIKFDFDLIRLPDGRFVSNPGHLELNPQHFDLQSKNGYGSEGHRWTTAFNALIFSLSHDRLRLTGGGKAHAVAR